MPRVLLIDDDPLFGKIFAHQAERKGCEVVYHESLIDAVYGGDLQGYDAVILDCAMPGTDGFELSDYFHTFLGRIPVVLISARQGYLEKFAKDTHGAAAFVHKSRGVAAILAAALEGPASPRYVV
jgi:CheY-like chemotaxis protein